MSLDGCVLKANRWGNHEGAIYRQGDDGLWITVISVPEATAGRSRRYHLSARTKSDAIRKPKATQRHLQDGPALPEASVAAEYFPTCWREDVLLHQASSAQARQHDREQVTTAGDRLLRLRYGEAIRASQH
jgi:hypothetical protein